jgi:hypothetical protein
MAAFILIFAVTGGCSQAGSASWPPFNREALYIATNGATGVSFGERMGIGTLDKDQPLPAMLRLQEWSEPTKDCSNEIYSCIAAGKFVIFLPREIGSSRRLYEYMGFSLKTVSCTKGQCTYELSNEAYPNEALSVYLRADEKGVKSLGFGESGGDAISGSLQFSRASKIGLFGRIE